MKDRELGLSSGKGFEDDDDEEEFDIDENRLNEMMRARFGRGGGSKESGGGMGSGKDFLFEDGDDDDLQGFEDLDEEMDDGAYESQMRQ